MILLLMTLVAAPAATDVGVVAEYRPATGRFVLARGAEEIPIRIGTVVQAGDRVSLPPGAAVIVQLATGKPLVLEASATVPSAPTVGRLAQFFRSIPGLFDAEFRQARTAASRGTGRCDDVAGAAPLTMPIVGDRGAAILAGTRDLPLVWGGGCAPYRVTLLRGADTVAWRGDLESGQVRLDRTTLRPGPHLLVVTDGGARRLEATIDVVGALPALPPDLANADSDLGIIAQAVWLAQQDGGRWRFDSFERLRPLIRAGNPLAGAVADGILWGRD